MTPFQVRLTQIAGIALLVGCFALNSTVLAGSGFESTLGMISGVIFGWLGMEKPQAMKRRDSLSDRPTQPETPSAKG